MKTKIDRHIVVVSLILIGMTLLIQYVFCQEGTYFVSGTPLPLLATAAYLLLICITSILLYVFSFQPWAEETDRALSRDAEK